MSFIDYYLKACAVVESCKTTDHCLTAMAYLRLLQQKFPDEEAITNLIDLTVQIYENVSNVNEFNSDSWN